MNINAHNFKLRFLFIIFSLVMCVLSISCGIDVYYILYPPTEAKVVNDETDALGRYFSFRTNDIENSGMDIFSGTTVFYKIYNSDSQLVSDTYRINNNNAEFSDNGFKMIESLGYQELVISNKKSPLVAKSGTNRTVEIRLFTEGYVDNPYRAGISVSGEYILDGSDYAIPLRSENDATFSFYSQNEYTVVNGVSYPNEIPSDEDIDVKYTQFKDEENQENKWYVNAFAVSVGITSDFTYRYSELEYLGYILIDEADF